MSRINLSPSNLFTHRVAAYAEFREISLSRAVVELATYGLQLYESDALVPIPREDLEDIPQHGGARPGAGRPRSD